MTSPVNRIDSGRPEIFQALLIGLAAIWIYAPALHGVWIWDDGPLVASNYRLRTLHGLWEIWFSAPTTDYWPLSWTALWVQWHLWDGRTFGYHVCDLALHITSGFLIWRLLNRLGLRSGWLGGLLFVIHPLAVESVAWISEIKNALSLPFFLLSLDAWLDFEDRKALAYPRSILFYLAAMLSKTSNIMLPFVLLFYCWWKRGSLTRQEILRTIPYLAIAVVLGLVTIYFQDFKHVHTPTKAGDLEGRLVDAGSALFFYLGKFFLPVDLAPIYPPRSTDSPIWQEALTLPLVAGVLFILWTRRATWGRHVLFGFGFFLLNLLPVLGLIKMKYLNVSWVADHLVYLPMIGLAGLVVAGWQWVMQRMVPPLRFMVVVPMAVAMAWLAWEAHAYAALFSNDEAFWRYTLGQNPGSVLAHNDLAYCLVAQGKISEAREELEEALRLDPTWLYPRNSLGTIELGRDEFPEAEANFRAVLTFDPTCAYTHVGLAQVMTKTGRTSEAVQEYQAALRSEGEDPATLCAFADLLLNSNRPDEAAELYRQALISEPDLPSAEDNLAGALARTGHSPEALEHYRRAVQIDPDFPGAQLNLANALALEGRAGEAVVPYEAALRIDPRDAQTRSNYGTALLQLGRVPEAIAQYEVAVLINPNAVNVRLPLGFALGRSGRYPEAAAQFEAVLKLDPQNAQAKTFLEKIRELSPTP